MIDHFGINVTDIKKSTEFYKKVLETLDCELRSESDKTACFGQKAYNGLDFWLVKTEETPTPIHIAFTAPSKEAVEKFHEVALAEGATDNGAPGFRPIYHEKYYAAFVIDSDGYNIEAVFLDWDN